MSLAKLHGPQGLISAFWTLLFLKMKFWDRRVLILLSVVTTAVFLVRESTYPPARTLLSLEKRVARISQAPLPYPSSPENCVVWIGRVTFIDDFKPGKDISGDSDDDGQLVATFSFVAVKC